MESENEDKKDFFTEQYEQRMQQLKEKRQQYERLLKTCSEPNKNVIENEETITSTYLVESVIEEAKQAALKAVENDSSNEPDSSVSKPISSTTVQKEVKKNVKPDSLLDSIKLLTQSSLSRARVINLSLNSITLTHYDKSCQSELIENPLTTNEIEHTESLPLKSSFTTLPERLSAEEALALTCQPSSPITKEKSTLIDTEQNEDCILECSNAERRDIFSSSKFEKFFAEASKTVECALGETDFFSNYRRFLTSTSQADSSEANQNIRLLQAYENRQWTTNRPILDLRTHPHYHDIFLAAYGRKFTSTLTDPSGCVLVWNLARNNQPEHEFICHSAVCSSTFDPYRVNCVIGGLYSGAVVVWDNRAKKHPVQRTPFSTKSHLHPIYSMEIVGTENSHNLITLDKDGCVCLWSLCMMGEPTKTFNLKTSSDTSLYHCFGFGYEETNSFLSGTDNGSIVSVQLHGTKTGVTKSLSNAHKAPVTALHWHPSLNSFEGTFEITDLVLSSSFDWDVKLWSLQQTDSLLCTFAGGTSSILDVQWHPKHPGMFATCTADGLMYVWDMSHDVEVPCITQADSLTNDALLELSWNKEGNMIMTGSCNGKINLWGLPKEKVECRDETIEMFQATLNYIMSQQNTFT